MISLLGRVARGLRRAGLGSVLRSAVGLVDRPLIRLGRAPLRATVDGLQVRGFLRHRSYLAEAMRPRETYAELFVSLLRPGMTVVDGGAHVGLYTLLGSRGVGPDGTVFAVEPDRYNLAALRVNAAAAANVEIVPRALSDSEGVTTFYETRSTIGSSLIERNDAKARRVETTSIDLLLDGRDLRSLLVKLNIEGAEPLALRGMTETLGARRRDRHLRRGQPAPPRGSRDRRRHDVRCASRAGLRDLLRRPTHAEARAAARAAPQGSPARQQERRTVSCTSSLPVSEAHSSGSFHQVDDAPTTSSRPVGSSGGRASSRA